LAASVWGADERMTTATPGDRWPMFRGDSGLTGVSAASLADELKPLWVF
jgi:hypothetical protein